VSSPHIPESVLSHVSPQHQPNLAVDRSFWSAADLIDSIKSTLP
jgi:hypothetical protein